MAVNYVGGPNPFLDPDALLRAVDSIWKRIPEERRADPDALLRAVDSIWKRIPEERRAEIADSVSNHALVRLREAARDGFTSTLTTIESRGPRLVFHAAALLGTAIAVAFAIAIARTRRAAIAARKA